MSIISSIAFTKDQLFTDLKEDGITIAASTIKKAKNGDSNALNEVGWEYQHEKKKYDKAMTWYRLAAAENNSAAQNNIGILYHNGEGVPKDYILAIEWYLKAAIQHDEMAWGNIGLLFEHGKGVPQDKYKALEWYYKSGNKSARFKALTGKGTQLTLQDKRKPIGQLILETEDILVAARKKREDEREEEINSLKLLNTQMEEQSRVKDDKIKSLEEENQTYRHTTEQMQKEMDEKNKRQDELEEEIKSFNQPKSNIEEDVLAKDDKIKSLEEENQTQRLELEQKQKEINDQRGSLEQYKQECENINSEILSLKTTNAILISQLEAKENHIKSLERVATSFYTASERPLQNTSRKNDELERSYQNLERLLEQERRLKDNEIMLLKQEMEAFLNEEKKEKRKLEEESQAMQHELKRLKTAATQSSSTENINNTGAVVIGDIENQGEENSNGENGISDSSDDSIKMENID